MIRNVIILVVNLFIIVLLFFIKNKKKDNSLSFKLLVLFKREYPLIVSSVLLYIVSNYIYFSAKYDNVDSKKIYEVIWKQISRGAYGIIGSVTFVVKSLFETQVLVIIIGGYFAVKILASEDIFDRIKYFISQIKEINFKDFSLKTQEAKKVQENKEKEIETLIALEKSGQISPKEAELQINEARARKEIISIMIDNTKIVKYIDSFINKGSQSISIPKNLVPSKITLGVIDKLFEYELGSNSIKLNKIIPEKVDLVKEVFSELHEKGIIFLKE